MTKVLLTGGGIAGLCLRLTLQEIGVTFQIFETSRKIKPLDVGINLQTPGVREPIDLELHYELMDISVETKNRGCYTKTRKEI